MIKQCQHLYFTKTQGTLKKLPNIEEINERKQNLKNEILY
jgi:hypothetical protein